MFDRGLLSQLPGSECRPALLIGCAGGAFVGQSACALAGGVSGVGTGRLGELCWND